MELMDMLLTQAAPNTPSIKTIRDVDAFLNQFLVPHLPWSLPLLERCQFHRKHKQSAPNAEIWFAATSEAQSHSESTWIATYIDLTNSGETQIWIFALWESEFSTRANPRLAIQESPKFPIYQQLIEALFRHLKQNHIPNLSHNPPPQWLRLKAEGKIVSEPFSRSKVLFGTIAECNWPFLDEYERKDPNSAISRADRSYLKYIVSSKPDSLPPRNIPETLHFAPMQDRHLQTIVDRTNIPRTLETLKQLPNVGIFDRANTPVAWGLLDKDGSLSSLHTEPEYRRRGLAALVARRLIAAQTSLFDEAPRNHETSKDTTILPQTIYSHADVSDKNVASQKVMENVGGKAMWRTAWIEIDIGET
ncbi:hypothetical protein LTS08_005566 [Lithohypha guttulata]|nr:hypothetical protein LTS08_005566 [Lithohypha guttulata]